ncbi:hypothetical protein IAI52_27925 [Pseudomonas lurida]|uniref:hypothetical protein n=1 Tax=Pseudomonas lurida TaxID=244566 RepID=UPI001656B2E4|nr:hypothetical protein [Pseudomonas lurida]MBC8984080.1 hypothetical protein [Pseudomonas lurida]
MSEKPPAAPRIPNGVCHYCGAPAVPFGCFCPACYGAILHPEGLPMVPGDPDDPYRAFNAEADAGMADRKMPAIKAMAGAVEWAAYCRATESVEQPYDQLPVIDPVIDAMVRAIARPGEAWADALERAHQVYAWTPDMYPRQMVPCPCCVARFPEVIELRGWIWIGPNSPRNPPMCSGCEADQARQPGEDQRNYMQL